jgi:acetyl-CoA acetyltransferase
VQKSREAVIVGVAESDLGVVPGLSPLDLMAQASVRALNDAGISKREVDGLFSASAYYYMPTVSLGEYLGIVPRYTDSTTIGGSSFVAHLRHAKLAVESGACTVALIAYGSTQRSDGGTLVTMAEPLAYEIPHGLPYPIGAYALAARRHMAQFGTTPEQLAAVAVQARAWALLNPKAFMHDRGPLTVEDVLASPLIADPLHLLDCCLVTDGGGAVVVTTRERARDLPRRPVRILGAGESHTHRGIMAMPDLTRTAARESGAQAFAEAGLRPSDIDFVELYDAFTINTILFLEDLGFCAKGEGARLSPRDESGRAVRCRSTPTAVGCRIAIRGCTVFLRSSKLYASCGAKRGRDSCRRPGWDSSTATAGPCRVNARQF